MCFDVRVTRVSTGSLIDGFRTVTGRALGLEMGAYEEQLIGGAAGTNGAQRL